MVVMEITLTNVVAVLKHFASFNHIFSTFIVFV